MSAILRHHGSGKHFVQVSNDLVRHPEMSFKAKGMLIYLLSHRDGWDLSERRMAEQVAEGRTSISSGLQEIENFGYLHRCQVRQEDGSFGKSVWHVTDDPRFAPEQCPDCGEQWCDSPWSENPTPVAVGTDSPTTKNTSSKKTRTKNTSGSNGRRTPAHPLPDTWEPTQEQIDKMQTRVPGIDVEAETEEFRDHARANDRRQRDWDAAWRNWLRKARKYAEADGRLNSGRPTKVAL